MITFFPLSWRYQWRVLWLRERCSHESVRWWRLTFWSLRVRVVITEESMMHGTVSRFSRSKWSAWMIPNTVQIIRVLLKRMFRLGPGSPWMYRRFLWTLRLGKRRTSLRTSGCCSRDVRASTVSRSTMSYVMELQLAVRESSPRTISPRGLSQAEQTDCESWGAGGTPGCE